MRHDFIRIHAPLVLCHGDLGPSNLIVTESGIILIDFSLCGYSAAEMDLASLLCQIDDSALHGLVVEAYRAHRPADQRLIDVCMCFQILLFVVCQHEKVWKEDWFEKSLNRWIGTRFTALIEG